MQHTVTFEHAGHRFEAKVEEVPQTLELDCENVLQRGMSAHGTAKLMVLREAIKSLYRDGQPQNLRDSKGALRIPPIRDPETREGLINPLLRAAVQVNDFLGYVEPFKDVFESYLPGDAEGESPTATGDTSPSSSSISSIAPAQTPESGTTLSASS